MSIHRTLSLAGLLAICSSNASLFGAGADPGAGGAPDFGPNVLILPGHDQPSEPD
jgi:hypothetical protein